MLRLFAGVVAATAFLLACTARHPTGSTVSASSSKIAFDIAALDEDGLTGPSGGRRALSYEFCIPDDPDKRSEVRAVDPTVTVHSGSSGRIGCTDGEALCIGSTHQPGFRTVLAGLSQLDYVHRIEQCFFE